MGKIRLFRTNFFNYLEAFRDTHVCGMGFFPQRVQYQNVETFQKRPAFRRNDLNVCTVCEISNAKTKDLISSVFESNRYNG